MSQHADEKKLGEHLVTTGKLTSEELAACFEVQRLGLPDRTKLAQILVDQGHITPQELHDTMMLMSPQRRQDDIEGATTNATIGSPPAIDSAFATGQADRRIGQYEVLDELGHGGMGVVFRCHDPHLNREVAVKMVATDKATGPQRQSRLLQEAQLCAKLRHPNIVAVHEAGEHGGRIFLVMDLVRGQALSQVIDGRSLSAPKASEITRDIALGLQHAHDAGIIHRDVKPDNIMLDEARRPLLMDFGLAKDISARQQLTQTGQLLGTPLYMAPEQITTSTVGPGADIYSLGAVLYHALTGRPPLEAENSIALFRKIASEDPRPLRDLNSSIPNDLETITLKCLEKECHRRYGSAAELAADIQRFLDGGAIMARPVGSAERAARWARRNPELSVAITAMIVILLGATATVFQQSTKAANEREHLQRSAERNALRREERARLKAELSARDQEDAAIAAATRRQRERLAADALKDLRNEVKAVLDEVRSGELLADQNDREIAKARILKHRELETTRLLSNELDTLTQHLTTGRRLSLSHERLLHFLCETLWNLGHQEHAVSSIGGYLRAEFTLPPEKMNEMRAVPAGKALCLLGGEEAEALLQEAQRGFGISSRFWEQIIPLYGRTGAEPKLESETSQAYQERGSLRLAKDDLDGAMADFTEAIRLDPKNAVAWANRGNVRKALGNVEKAISDISQAIGINPTAAKFWNNRGLAHAENDDLDSAIADHTRAIEIDPQQAAAWNNRGNAKINSGDHVGGIADLSRAIEIRPLKMPAWYNRGLARLKEGDLDGAIADLTQTIKLRPDFAPAFDIRGTARHGQGNLDSAIADHTRAIEIDPQQAAAWNNRGTARKDKGDYDGAIADHSHAIALNQFNASAWNNRGNAQAAKGKLEAAIADYSQAIELAPRDWKAWCNRGGSLQEKGDLGAAIRDFSAAIEIDPTIAESWIFRGLTLASRGAIDAAISDLSKAIELDPGLAQAWRNRGILRLDKGDIDGAIADHTKAIEVDPANATHWRFRGNVRRHKGDLVGAIQDLSRALEIDPLDAAALNNRGGILFLQGNHSGAIADYSRTIELEPMMSAAWYSRGTVRKQTGDINGAIDDFSRAVEIDPSHTMAWYNRGNARATKNDIDGALNDYTRSIETDPLHAAAWHNRANLRMTKGDIAGAISDFEKFLELRPDHPNASSIRDWLRSARQGR